MTIEGSDPFSALKDPIGGLENVLKEVDATPALTQPRLLFVRLREDQVLIHEFVEILSDQLVNYALPLAKRQKAVALGAKSVSGGDTSAQARLQREAVGLLVRFNRANPSRYGEIGELVSYVVAIHFLAAAQVGSKMALKTSTEMPVHGVDGLHARTEPDGTITFLVLESKVIPNPVDASRDFCDSVAKYQADRKARANELRIASDLSNLDSLAGDQREAAKAYFNLYSGDESSLKRRERHVGSLIFSESGYGSKLPVDSSRPIDIHEKNFMSIYVGRHENMSEALARQAKAKSVDLGSCIVFMIAVPDVDGLKRIFAETNSGHIRN